MIGIADPKLWNLGVGLLSKWSSLTFSFFLFTILGFFNYSMPGPIGIFFFCFTPRNSSSAGLGQNSRASISSIAKMRSSSLICLLAVIVASRENR